MAWVDRTAHMFKISARTVLELGSELISSDIIAFYELIKNGFDARTTSGVEISFEVVLCRSQRDRLRRQIDAAGGGDATESLRKAVVDALETTASADIVTSARERVERTERVEELAEVVDALYRESCVTIADTGSGMSMSDLTEKYLTIGTASRMRAVQHALDHGERDTPYLGEKGIGRLSAMRLGDCLRVETATHEDANLNILDLDWTRFADLDAMLDEILIEPRRGTRKPFPEWSGTRLKISALTADWSLEKVRSLAQREFSRLTDPFSGTKERPRIALLWGEERIAIPRRPVKLLSAAHASATGRYEIADGMPVLSTELTVRDLGFDHPLEIDPSDIAGEDLEGLLVGPSRDFDPLHLTSVGPFSFEMHWFNRRRLTKVDGIGDRRAVLAQQEQWSGILLYRDGFRVFPYGSEDDDWLELDRRALRRSGYTLNKTQLIGRVEISRMRNPGLVDQTNREGLRETAEQRLFFRVLQYVIERLFLFMKDVERKHKGIQIDLTGSKREVDQLEKRARLSLKRLRRVVGKSERGAVDEVEEVILEFQEFAGRARQRIEQVEREGRQLVEMAGVGLMVEVVAHELARASEHALDALNRLKQEQLPANATASVRSLREQMKTLSKRIRVLDPLSVSGRQRWEVFNLDSLVDDVLAAHEGEFTRHAIRVQFEVDRRPVRVRAIKGMIVQVLENLLSNSKYWLRLRRERTPGFRPEITVRLECNPPLMTFEDNGPGIATEYRERVFQPFFSLKDPDRRRGLGLYIARECAEFMGGSLVLEPGATGGERLHRFVLELPMLGGAST